MVEVFKFPIGRTFCEGEHGSGSISVRWQTCQGLMRGILALFVEHTVKLSCLFHLWDSHKEGC
jgi:hypothetical protein